MNLINLGYSSEYEENSGNNTGFNKARVITVNKESYIINDGSTEYFAKLTGNMLYTSDSPEDFPTVGDFVVFQKFDDDSLTIIHDILPRKSLLKRKSAGKKIDYQLIAANIDYAIIIQALDDDFNINRLERYLTMVREFRIEPIILFSKADLMIENERYNITEKIKERIKGAKIISFSNLEIKEVNSIKSLLKAKNTYCLIGSSGVGKTTLINNLLGQNEYKTREVREGDRKGKHTTTNRHLVILDNGAIIVDTPGMRELANISISDGIDQTFDEILGLSKACKFSDCSHVIEKGCAVLEALKNGSLDQRQYDNYIKLRKETDYYERSYLESRKRDKEFGKMVKSIMKSKNKRK